MNSSTGADVAAGPGQRPEVARRDGHRPIDVLAGTGDELVRRRRDVGGIGGERRSVGRRVVAEALGPGDRPPLGLDRLELLEADPVDLLGIDLERGPGQDLGPIQRVAVGRGPEAGIDPAGRQVVAAERLEEGPIGRVDDVADDLRIRLPVGVGGDLDGRC